MQSHNAYDGKELINVIYIDPPYNTHQFLNKRFKRLLKSSVFSKKQKH
ncbi:MAG: RsmD family RNA methyltransferase [Clostridia bacterium]|nr:RsmD family RNA methyltransferase [Clostridia bacterium]